MKNMKKAELLKAYQQLQEDYARLETNYNNLEEYAVEQEQDAYKNYNKLENMKKSSIVNVDEFLFKLKLDGLYTQQLEDFIRNFVKYQ